jgi:hypothetical protein
MVFIQGQTVTVTDTEQGSQWQNVLAWRACNLQGLRRPIQSYKLLFKLFFFFCWDWGLNSGICTCKAGALLLEPHPQSILLWLFWRWGLLSPLPRLDWNLDLPDLSFPYS